MSLLVFIINQPSIHPSIHSSVGWEDAPLIDAGREEARKAGRLLLMHGESSIEAAYHTIPSHHIASSSPHRLSHRILMMHPCPTMRCNMILCDVILCDEYQALDSMWCTQAGCLGPSRLHGESSVVANECSKPLIHANCCSSTGSFWTSWIRCGCPL